MLRIVTMYRFTPEEAERIRAAAPQAGVEIVACATPQEFLTQVRDADVVYGDIRADGLAVAGKLRWVQAYGAGVESLDPALRESPVVVTNYQGTFAHGISETALGMLLGLSRGLVQHYVPQFARREWKPVGSARSADHVEMAGRTMGFAGFGGIGRLTARRAHYGLDMRIVATDAKVTDKPAYVAELRDPSWFREMASQVDVLVAAAPLTPETEGMFDEQVFRSMKKTAYFLALSRGKLFDDMALVKALQEGWIAGAGLDVFPVEPPPSSHPIFDCPNVVMSMHTSGWSVERQTRLIDDFAENVRRYAAGEPLRNVVDKQAGY
jgi:phosphoglycerate dehydrogenase-like enzyme